MSASHRAFGTVGLRLDHLKCEGADLDEREITLQFVISPSKLSVS